jgi:hypothetical protein
MIPRPSCCSLARVLVAEDDAQLGDALQVLGELFNAIHRAQLGSAAERAADPQLPVKIRLNAQGGVEGKGMLNGAASPKDAPALQSLVQRLFGQQVQACLVSASFVLVQSIAPCNSVPVWRAGPCAL